MKALIYPINFKQSYKLNTIEYPISAYLKLTNNCMFRCSFCSQGKSENKFMNLSLAKKILKELQKIGVRYITYTGGEPLLYEDILDVVKFGHSLGFTQAIVTTLFPLFNVENEEVLKYIDQVGVSFHGRDITYNKIVGNKIGFQALVKNIDKLTNMGCKVNLNYTICQQNMNYEDMKYALDFAMGRSLRLCFGRINYVGLSEHSNIINPDDYLQIVSEFKSEYDKVEISNCIPFCEANDNYKYLLHGCGAGISLISFEPNGDVTICPTSNYVIGNVNKQGIFSIWKSAVMKKFRNMNYLSNACRICKYLNVCKGGCHVEESGCFCETNCDSVLENRYNKIWNNIKDKHPYLRYNKFRKEKREYLLFANPSRLINKVGFNILKQIDESETIEQIVKNNKSVSNCKDFIIALYIDKIIGI